MCNVCLGDRPPPPGLTPLGNVRQASNGGIDVLFKEINKVELSFLYLVCVGVIVVLMMFSPAVSLSVAPVLAVAGLMCTHVWQSTLNLLARG